MNNEWEYYNHALVPTLPPHIGPDISWMKDSAKWKEYAGGKVYDVEAPLDRIPVFVRK